MFQSVSIRFERFANSNLNAQLWAWVRHAVSRVRQIIASLGEGSRGSERGLGRGYRGERRTGRFWALNVNTQSKAPWYPMAQFVDRPLPEALELPRLQEPRPRDKRRDNLRNGPGFGRPRGSQGKVTKDLKEGLIEGAVLCGYNGAGEGGLVGYCRWLAERHPKVYGHLLAKLLPYNLNATSAAIQTVKIVSIPSGVFLNHEQMELAQQGKPFTIDHDEPAPCEEPVEPAPPEVPATTKEPIVQQDEALSPEEAELLARLAALGIEEFRRLLDAVMSEPAKASSVKYESMALHLPQAPIPPSRSKRPPGGRW